MSSPSNFARPKVRFKRLDDLPNKGKGAPHTADEIMAAMKVLHRMVHAQAAAYGGEHSKLLPVGIAEGGLLRQVAGGDPTERLEEGVDTELEAAYRTCETLRRRLGGDKVAMDLLLTVIQRVNRALRLVQDLHEGGGPTT